uniref:Sel1 repeat family protein n=1 Tax=Panagrolaimus davidi TaxID=227884 RepID=A0A914P296_9BILA
MKACFFKRKFDKIFNRDPGLPEKAKKKLWNRFKLSENELTAPETLACRFPEAIVNFIRGYQAEHGICVQKDYKKAFEFFEKAANMGNAEAMFKSGKLHFIGGFRLKQDYEGSVKWFLKAATLDKTDDMRVFRAQYILGLLYTFGIGVNKDYRKAAKMYEKSVANGFTASANNLGSLYAQGLGVVKSYMKSFYHFKMCAEDGHTGAMVNLAKAYFIAEGTELTEPTQEFINEGKKWLQIAAAEGDQRAIAELQISQDLTPPHAMMIKLVKIMESD